MIIHTCENGQRVSYPTAERSETKDGFIRFYDLHDEEVGLQPVAVEPSGPIAPPPNPPESLGSALLPEEEKPNDKLSDSTASPSGAPDRDSDSNGSVPGEHSAAGTAPADAESHSA